MCVCVSMRVTVSVCGQHKEAQSKEKWAHMSAMDTHMRGRKHTHTHIHTTTNTHSTHTDTQHTQARTYVHTYIHKHTRTHVSHKHTHTSAHTNCNRQHDTEGTLPDTAHTLPK